MSEAESYVTKARPTLEDWLEYNQNYFASLRGEVPTDIPYFAPLTDIDMHAERAGVSLEEYYEQVKERVGVLGAYVLRLVHSPMDDAWHLVVRQQEGEA